MTVAGNIAFGMEMRGVPKAERDAAIAKVADLLQIGHLLDRKPVAALRRPAPARRHGPRAGARSRRSSCSTSRCPTSTPSCASTCAPRSSALHQRMKTTDRLRHPRPDRGDDAGDQDRRAEGRLSSSSSARRRRSTTTPVNHVRRRLHGLAGDEPRAARRSAAPTAALTAEFEGATAAAPVSLALINPPSRPLRVPGQERSCSASAPRR